MNYIEMIKYIDALYLKIGCVDIENDEDDEPCV